MIYVVSTEVKNGKGGISTALVGLSQASSLKHTGLQCITSHKDNGRSYFFSAIKILYRSVNRGDIVWLHCGPWFSIFRKMLLGMVAKYRGAKVVLHFHSPKMHDYLKQYWWRITLKTACNLADGVVVLTPWWRTLFLDVFPDLDGKMLVSPNPLDDQLMAIAKFSREESATTNHIKLLAMARLSNGKGFQAAISAMTKLPERYQLSIAGDGPLMTELRNQVVSLGLQKRVKFLGWIDYSQKHQVLMEHDIFLLPSKYDSFGMGYIEAMAYGLPIVALAYQAIPDVVPDGRAGILCQSDDPQVLANAVVNCYQKRIVMANAGKQHVLQHFDKNMVSDKLVIFFERLSG